MKFKKKNIIHGLTISLLMILIGCDNHNEMIEWTGNIPVGTDMTTIIKNQPDFLEIDWTNPDTLKYGITRYFITKTKWSNDILNMEYYLEFENNKFRGRFGHK